MRGERQLKKQARCLGHTRYDNAGRLTGIDYTHSTTTLDNMTWTLDAAGRVEDFTSSVDGTAAYSYDNANQLLGATYTGNGEPPNESYSFDSNGNRSMTGYTTGTNNQTTSDGTYNYSYDADGNRITRTQIASTQNSDYKTAYSFDYRNRLTDVYDYNNSGTLTAHYHYVYDVWDNLIGEEIDPTGGGTYTSSRWYAWDVGSQLPIAGQPALVYGPAGPGGIVAQFDGNGNLLVRYFDGPSTTVHTDAAFEVLGEEDIASQGAAGTPYFMLTDDLDTLRDIADANGTVQDHLVYTAFGQIFSESNSSISHWQDFAFQHLDGNTGLALDGHRWYDPATGKWLSEDPEGFRAGDPNLERYSANDVINLSDAAGLDPEAMETPSGPRGQGMPIGQAGYVWVWVPTGERKVKREVVVKSQILVPVEGDVRILTPDGPVMARERTWRYVDRDYVTTEEFYEEWGYWKELKLAHPPDAGWRPYTGPRGQPGRPSGRPRRSRSRSRPRTRVRGRGGRVGGRYRPIRCRSDRTAGLGSIDVGGLHPLAMFAPGRANAPNPAIDTSHSQ